jgi:hypothetical protein
LENKSCDPRRAGANSDFGRANVSDLFATHFPFGVPILPELQ